MQINEVLQMAILKMDAMTDDELLEFLKMRHEILLSENVVQAFNDASVRKIISDPDQEADDEIERPAA